MECRQAAYFGLATLSEPDGPWTIRQLDENHLDFVAEHYSHIEDRDYLLGRLRSGVLLGAFLDGQLAGFIGMHAEGSIGILEVLPAYRRRGIAEALEIRMANRLLGRGHVPYTQIAAGNQASLALQEKLGFAVSEKPLWWLF